MEDFFENYKKIIADIAEQCIKKLSPEDIEGLKAYPCSTAHHFNYGMYIRNHYIYPNKQIQGFCADDLSSEIIKQILFCVVPGYNPTIDGINNEQ